ncbi:MAG TPA: HlyD family efflux transporter periplasmic adaptor subunit [Sumerlaeia bacterium]|nr:HlyD family efflux transporter periplasmic adaptor subunit [Sumerlaeia bacterium]
MKRQRVPTSAIAVSVILAVAAAVFAWLKATKPEPAQRQPSREGTPVEVMRATAAPADMNVVAYGTVEAKRDLRLVAQVAGEIVYVAPSLRTGGFFEKGELLVRIDPRSYELAVRRLEATVQQGEVELRTLEQEKRNAEADLALAEAETDLARRALDRARQLLKSASGSQAACDEAERGWISSRSRAQSSRNQLALLPERYAASQARLRQTRAQLEDARLNLEHAEIRAPFAGRAAEEQIEVGQFVNVSTLLARIYDVSAMEIALQVPLEDFLWVDTARLPGSGSGTPPGNPGADPLLGDAPRGVENAPRAVARLKSGGRTFEWEGRLARVLGEIDRVTRTAGLVVEFRDPAPRGEFAETAPPFLPGLFVEVEIQGRSVERAIALPRGAIDEEGRVHLAVEERLVSRPVGVLRNLRGLSFVESGVDAGDLVIVSPLSAPVENMKLRLIYREGTGLAPSDAAADADASPKTGPGEGSQ